MSSIFVMYEHNNSRSGAFDMAHIMASPNVAGLVSPAFSFGDIYAGNFSLVDATFAAAKGKPVVLRLAPNPAPSVVSTVTINGAVWPAMWEPANLAVLSATHNALSQYLSKKGWLASVADVRLCFLAPPHDCEQGVGLTTDAAEWIKAGMTVESLTSAMRVHAVASANAYPDVLLRSLSILDPMSNRIGPNGKALHGRDMGTLAKELNDVVAGALLAMKHQLVVMNTNWSPHLDAADMKYTQNEGANYGAFALQTDDIGTTDTDFTALIKAGLAAKDAKGNCVKRLEVHQRQATAATLASL